MRASRPAYRGDNVAPNSFEVPETVRSAASTPSAQAIIAKHGRRTVRGLPQEVVVIFVEGLDDLLDVLKQMAPVLVLLSTTAILWWRSAHVVR